MIHARRCVRGAWWLLAPLVAVAAGGLLGAAGGARAHDKRPLVRSLAGAEVDWEAGTVTAEAGAAADLRMPGPDAARAAAQRQARARAIATLTDALRALPLGGGRKLSAAAAAAAAARAQIKTVDYQSSGGVILKLGVDFAVLTEPASRGQNADDGADGISDSITESIGDSIVIAVASMPLSVAPEVVVDGKERILGSAVYRMGEPPRDRDALSAKKDKAGRLLLKVPAGKSPKFQGARAVIFVRSVSKR